MKVKVGLFIGSLIISVLLLEGALHLFVYLGNHPVTLEQVALDKDYEQDDAYEVYKTNLSNDIEIYTMGDSFTNGGNVKYFETYPHQLWQKLDRKITINNLGMCESSSDIVYHTIGSLLKNKSLVPEKKYYFFILIGAADLFINSYMYSEKSKDSKFYYDFNIVSERTSINDFKTFKMMVFLFNKAKATYMMVKNKLTNVDDLFNIKMARECKKQTEDKLRWNCYEESIKRVPNTVFDRARFLGDLLKEVLQESDYSPQTAPSIVKELLYMMEMDKFYALDAELIINLIRHSKMQSVYSSAAILDKIDEKFKAIKAVDPKEYPQFFIDGGLLDVIKNYKVWVSNINSVEKLRWEYYEKIVNQLKPMKNVEVVFMTYPIAYSLNQQVRQFTKQNGLQILDLEKIFNEKIKNSSVSKYIDDWEHCTPLGYGVIADEIKAIINKKN